MLVTSTNEVGGGYVFGSVCVCVSAGSLQN